VMIHGSSSGGVLRHISGMNGLGVNGSLDLLYFCQICSI
jgi:hypothetical protein